MSDTTFVLLVFAGLILLILGLAVLCAVLLNGHLDRRDESRLDDEYEALRAAGYPMYPVWLARQQNGHADTDEGAPA